MALRLAITPGDPAGIGPDVLVTLAQTPQRAELVAYADPQVLDTRARQLGLPLTLLPHEPGRAPAPLPASHLRVCAVPFPYAPVAGQPDSQSARGVLAAINAAVDACQSGECAALVTGPVNKGLVNDAGIPFTGHTEYLAALTHSAHVVMMLATDGLRVALATTHLPLREVPDAITPLSLERTLRVLHRDLARYFCQERTPVILVAGLNPHAGDGGALGQEERRIIAPVIDALAREGLGVSGPYSADTLFSPANLARADVFLAMYHDQGLPVLKYKGFSNAINVTLGLDIIRTSVDHGTAYDLAGSGKADHHSLQRAIDTAIDMATHREIRRDA